jgi:8-amino-7-oxononanoate synthase
MFYQKELDIIKKSNRFRQRKLYDEDLIDVASNDYLGLSTNKSLLHKAYKRISKYKFNSSKSSLLVNGYHPIHKKFERKLCKLNHFKAGITVGSGFLANIALIESMVRKNDILFIDEEYHASGMLASKLIQGQVIVFKHNDAQDLKVKIKKYKTINRSIIAIEGVYSMSGDIALKEIEEIANIHNSILIVDEAHSSGVIGNNLLGWYDYWHIIPKYNHIKIGTLGKAYGSYGAYILASTHIVEFLLNRAKPIIYTTAPSLFDIALALENFKFIVKHKKKIKRDIESYQNIVYNILKINTKSLIVPILIHDNYKVIQIQQKLISYGFIIGAIRQPTVGNPMLRLILKLDIKIEEIEKICRIIEVNIKHI